MDAPSGSPAHGDPQESFSAAVAHQRRARGWTQKELSARLADLVGRKYSQTTISQWEKAKAEIPGEVRDALLALFGGADELLSGVDRVDVGPGADASPLTSPATQSDNFQLWRACVGLDDSFPRLSGVKPFLNQDRMRELHKLVDFTASPIGPSVVVTFAAGHGITTFARHAQDLLFRREIRSSVLPVPVFLDDALGPAPRLDRRDARRPLPERPMLGHDELVERVRRRVVGALALKPRKTARLEGWLGRQALADDPSFEPLYAPLDDAGWESIDIDPVVRDLPLHELIRDAGVHGIDISLFIDVSSTPEAVLNSDLRQAIGPLFEEVAAMQLDVRERTETTFSVVAFAPQEDVFLLKRAMVSAQGGLANPDIIAIRPYAPFEVYRMLMDEYGEDLSAKLEPTVLLGIVDPGIALDRTQDMLREFLLEQCSDINRVTYSVGSSTPRRGAWGS